MHKIENRHFFFHQYPSGCCIMYTWTRYPYLRVIIRRNRHSIVRIIWTFLKSPLIPGCGAIVLYILLLRNIAPVLGTCCGATNIV